MVKAKKNRRLAGNHQQQVSSGVIPKVSALLCWVFALVLVLAFFDKAGVGGHYLLRALLLLIGQSIYTLPFVAVLAGLVLWPSQKTRHMRLALIAVAVLLVGELGLLGGQNPDLRLGGLLGFALSWPILKVFGFWVNQLLFGALIVASFIAFKQLLALPAKELLTMLRAQPAAETGSEQPMKLKIKPAAGILAKAKVLTKPKPLSQPTDQPVAVVAERARTKPLTYPLDLLVAGKGSPDTGDIEHNQQVIKTTLENFGIPVDMGSVNIGPTVAQYTLKPAEGIKLSKITALNNNLALALAAHPLRMEAPIPGQSLVGIEVPNRSRAEVRLRDLLSLGEFQKNPQQLSFSLGKDVAGLPMFANLGKMPHLLVAGATGAGKTIFLNSLILSLLQKNTPETLRVILVDPKRVELHVYRDIPHLLGEVIVEADKTVLAIRWLISEMENRFKLLASVGSRDIDSYNGKLSALRHRQPELETMPYIVFIIDELADLMVSKGKEVEAGVVRLAQMARAVGIHLVLATQRPSVEVLTGLIKANITSRVALKVATQIDSRTILDAGGAEKLLGAGDALYISAASPQPKRVQSAYVSEKEVKGVSEWLKNQNSLYFEHNGLSNALLEAINTQSEAGAVFHEFGQQGADELYAQAKEVVIRSRKASASLLQRRLRIGYARAARLLDLLEENGLVGPQEGAKPRKVYLEQADGGISDMELQ